MSVAAASGWRYGLMGLPLAFVALPLYVQLPARYANDFGVPLAALGLVLMAARLLDAALDPWLGSRVARVFARSTTRVLLLASGAALMLAAGFGLLVLPPVAGTPALLAWAALLLPVTYVCYSLLTVAHQSWGAMLAHSDGERARLSAWREGMGLAGVLIASVLPTVAGWPATAAVLAGGLALGWVAWARTRAPVPAPALDGAPWLAPWRLGGFRRLLAVFLANGIAAAVPATLLLFFLQDRLQAPAALQPLFLASYFLAAVLALPGWMALVARLGPARTWLAGMALSIVAFAGTVLLGPGDEALFLGVCLACGIALAADLALPPALLATVVARAGLQGRADAVFFGWWAAAGKLNLALAAGLALPLLAAAGYTPGDQSPASLAALGLAYCVLPCALKAGAALLLYLTLIRPGDLP